MSHGGRHEQVGKGRAEVASGSRPDYGYAPHMESGVFYGYQNRLAPNADSTEKNPPMSYPLPDATPQMKSEPLLSVDSHGTVRSVSPSGYDETGRRAVNAAWTPKGWFQVHSTGRLHRIYGEQQI